MDNEKIREHLVLPCVNHWSCGGVVPLSGAWSPQFAPVCTTLSPLPAAHAAHPHQLPGSCGHVRFRPLNNTPSLCGSSKVLHFAISLLSLNQHNPLPFLPGCHSLFPTISTPANSDSAPKLSGPASQFFCSARSLPFKYIVYNKPTETWE